MSLINLVAFVLLLLPYTASQGSTCFLSSYFGDSIGKAGYAECPTGEQFLYLKGLGLTGTSDNLKDISRGKCCQPPGMHQDWPYTCHSADWQLSFSR